MNIFAFEPVSDLLQAIGPAARLQILLVIGQGEACVGHLEEVLGWRQAYLSQHLMALRKAGVVVTTRQGRNIHYRLSDPRLLDLIHQAAELQCVRLPDLPSASDCSCSDCGENPDDRDHVG